MKKFFTAFFVVLGVIFLLQIIALAYFFIVDPWNIKTVLFSDGSEVGIEVKDDNSVNNTEVGSVTETTAPTNITPAQAKALEVVGINPDTALQFSIEQQACFEAILGAKRVGEIKAGAVPSLSEFNSVKSCL